MLIASLIALWAGPWLLCRFQGSPRVLMLLDGFSFMVIGGLVCLHIIPESLQQSLLSGLILVLLGFTGPALVERWVQQAARQAHLAALILAVLGLFTHSLIDGTAMSETVATQSRGALPLAVLLHRLPVGMMIWALLRPVLGFTGTIAVLLLMTVSTATGFVLGEQFEWIWHGSVVAGFQALVAGSLLHVLIHRPHWASGHHSEEHSVLGHRYEGIGNVLGIGLLIWLALEPAMMHADATSDSHQSVYDLILAMSYQSAPALLLAYALGGLFMTVLPATSMNWLRRGHPLLQAQKGMLAGLPLPICSCGVTPLYNALIRKGAPPAAAMAFLIATPELGVDALMISLPLLGSEMTVLRLLSAAILAVLVGWLVGSFTPTQAHSESAENAVQTPTTEQHLKQIQQGLRYGFTRLVDETAPWILFGLLLGAVLQPLLPLSGLNQLPDSADVFVFALLGMPLYVCASGATPLVAVLLLNGVSPGAALVFLLTGPATNATTFGVLQTLHGRNLAILFAAVTASGAIALGLLVNVGFAGSDWAPVSDWLEQPPGWIQRNSLIVLIGVFGLSLLRQGGRAFVQEIFPATAGHTHDHDQHAHVHGHDKPGHACCGD